MSDLHLRQAPMQSRSRSARPVWREKIEEREDLTNREIDAAHNWLERLSERAGERVSLGIRMTQETIAREERYLVEIEKAWSEWDWATLATYSIIDADHADLAEEILAEYPP
jgi:hypothetical protein